MTTTTAASSSSKKLLKAQEKMGGGNMKQRKTPAKSFSFLNIFKAGKGRVRRERGGAEYEGYEEGYGRVEKVWASDGDKGRHWAADPNIDRKAKAYIDRIHQVRVFETERQTFMLHPSATANPQS